MYEIVSSSKTVTKEWQERIQKTVCPSAETSSVLFRRLKRSIKRIQGGSRPFPRRAARRSHHHHPTAATCQMSAACQTTRAREGPRPTPATASLMWIHSKPLVRAILRLLGTTLTVPTEQMRLNCEANHRLLMRIKVHCKRHEPPQSTLAVGRSASSSRFNRVG